MKRVNFENGKITKNILGVAMPMLVAQLISLLYNVIGPEEHTCELQAEPLDHDADHC